MRAVRVVVRDEDAIDRLARRHPADPRALEVPLVGVERLRATLAARAEPRPVLVAGTQLGQVRAVGEREVDGGVGARVRQVVGDEARVDEVRELGRAPHPHVDVEDLVVRVAAPLGGVLPRVLERLQAGPAGARLGVVAAARAGPGDRAHVRRRRGRGVTVGQLDLGELHDVARARVAGDVQAVVPVGSGVGEPVLALLEALGEDLVGLGVERGPRLAVAGALEGPVARVALSSVVGRGERVVHDGDRLGELELDPAGGGEHQPLGLGGTVDEVLLHLAAIGVLAARPYRDHAVGDVAGDAGAPRAADPGGPLGGVRPRWLRIAGLERGREVVGRRGLRGRGQRQRRDDRQRPENPADRVHSASPPDNVVIPCCA